MPEGKNLRFELETRANGGPEGGKQSDEQGQHAGREPYQPSAQICNGDKRFRVSGRDSGGTLPEEMSSVRSGSVLCRRPGCPFGRWRVLDPRHI